MILGIDVGTQSLKAVLCDGDLAVRGQASVAYAPSFPWPGWAEQDPQLWEEALGPAIAGALRQAGRRADSVTAIGISGQLDGCLPISAGGEALAPALIWMDRRAEAEIQAIDPTPVRDVGGVVLDASHMAAKILWLRRHGPAGTRRFHQPVSYLVERLTGACLMDHGLASTTMLYSLAERRYDDRLLSLFHIDADWLPPLAPATAQAGGLSLEGARLTGLSVGTPVAVGTGDDFSAALGSGLATTGTLAAILGTAEVVGGLHGQPSIDADGLVETHAYLNDLYYIENPGWLAGGSVQWFTAQHRLAGPEEMDEVAAMASPGAEGLTFFPALSGAMAPRWDARARACYYGLSAAHGLPEMARSVLEGSAFAMRDVLQRLVEMGVTIDRLLLSGGGSRSQIWAQIRADLTGLPAAIPRHRDGSPLGAVLLAALATGQIKDLSEAAEAINPIDRLVEPDPAKKASYDAAYARYRRLADALRPLFDDWD